MATYSKVLQYTLPSPLWLARVHAQLEQFARPVLEKKIKGMVSITLEAEISIDLSLPQSTEARFFWSRPAEQHQLIGLGSAVQYIARGAQRFQALQQYFSRLQIDWTRICHGTVPPQARAFIGYAFDADSTDDIGWNTFPNSQLLLPELLLEWRQKLCTATFSVACDGSIDADKVIDHWMQVLQQAITEESKDTYAQSQQLISQDTSPAADEWHTQIVQLQQEIASGKVAKVVLSRQKQVLADSTFDLNALLRKLTHQYANCTMMAVDFGGQILLAATPEKLISARSGYLHSDALAGTLPSADCAEHQAMEINEHQPVVDAISQALQPLCTELHWPSKPVYMQLGSIKHMWTPFRGKIASDTSLFDLIKALHPTPAVGGMPCKAACDWIRDKDSTPRGWYTGGFGWLGDNDGEVSVILRCALLQDNQAVLFAGAGIVKTSDSDTELLETEQKFNAILQVLNS